MQHQNNLLSRSRHRLTWNLCVGNKKHDAQSWYIWPYVCKHWFPWMWKCVLIDDPNNVHVDLFFCFACFLFLFFFFSGKFETLLPVALSNHFTFKENSFSIFKSTASSSHMAIFWFQIMFEVMVQTRLSNNVWVLIIKMKVGVDICLLVCQSSWNILFLCLQ